MKNSVLTLLISFCSLTALATHNRAGEILYKRVAPFGTTNSPIYTYSITVIKYTDHGSTIADRCVDTVYFGDGQKGIAPRINGGTSLNCGCSGTIQCGQLILQQSGYTVKKNIYSILHTYAGAGTYTVSSSDPNRNAGIHNIPNSSSVPFYIESVLVINAGTSANSSPEFGSDPVNQATLGVCFYDNLNASDADGDSLSYELIPCAAPGYFYPEIPMTGTLSMDALTGTFTWCYPTLIAEYQVAYRVNEWRKNASNTYVIIGSVMRDRQVIVKTGTVGIVENSLENLIEVFPNPTNGNCRIRIQNEGQEFQYSVLELTGKSLITGSSSQNEIQLNLEEYPKGVYLFCIEQQSGKYYRKLIRD